MRVEGIWTNWIFEPSIVIGLVLWTVGYIIAVYPVRRNLRLGAPVSAMRQAAFHLGTLSAAMALFSPLDAVAELLPVQCPHGSAHAVDVRRRPLWLLGIPAWLPEFVLPPLGRRLLQQLIHPVSAFVIFNATVWLWHLPIVYDAALQNEALHILEHLLFIGTAIIGWWPVLGPPWVR